MFLTKYIKYKTVNNGTLRATKNFASLSLRQLTFKLSSKRYKVFKSSYFTRKVKSIIPVSD